MSNRFCFFCFIQTRPSSKIKSWCSQIAPLLALHMQSSESKRKLSLFSLWGLQFYLGVVNHTACAHCGGRDSWGAGKGIGSSTTLLCVYPLLLKRGFCWCQGGKNNQPSSILYCRSLCSLGNGWQAQLTRCTLALLSVSQQQGPSGSL